MAISSRPGVAEGVSSAICLAAVLATLVTIDARVRDQFTLLFRQASDGRLSTWGERLGELGGAIVSAARDQSIDNAPMLIFTFVAALIVFFLART